MQLPPFPPLINRNGADKEEYSEALHYRYAEKLENSYPTLLGRKVSLKRNQIVQGKNGMFWHLITGKETMNYKDIVYCRGERLLFIPYMIEYSDVCPKKIHWYFEGEGARRRIILISFDPHNRYQCVLQESKEGYQLITAYPPNKSRMLQKIKAYNEYWVNR